MNDKAVGKHKYTAQFKQEAVRHWLDSGKSAEVIAGELGLGAKRLYAWRQQAGPPAPPAAKPTTLAEAQAQLDAAQREIRHLREQRDILKKTLGIFSEPPSSATNASSK
jgi:transposase